MSTYGKLSSVLALALFLVACSSGISGTYADKNDTMSIKFESGKAYIQTSFGSTELDYKVDGDEVILVSSDGNRVLTRNKDGSLSGYPGGDLKKTGS